MRLVYVQKRSVDFFEFFDVEVDGRLLTPEVGLDPIRAIVAQQAPFHTEEMPGSFAKYVLCSDMSYLNRAVAKLGIKKRVKIPTRRQSLEVASKKPLQTRQE